MQREINENTNSLLREYLPKYKKLEQWSDEFIQFVVDKINNQPRKCLGWQTAIRTLLRKCCTWFDKVQIKKTSSFNNKLYRRFL